MTRVIAVVLFAGMLFTGSPVLAQESDVSAAVEETGPTIELQTLLEQVAEDSGKKFLVEAHVPQTIHIGGTDIRNPSYPALLSILRNNGLAAAEIGGYVNILPNAAIRQLPMPLVQRDDPGIPDDAWVSRVITLRNGSASRLVPILRPLLPQAGHLSAMGQETDDKLLIVASYAKVRHITGLAEALTE